MKTRCPWVGRDPSMRVYHDQEWGVPVHEDRKLFEILVLEGAQAGLSWATILSKRSGYRTAFSNFDPQEVAEFTDADIALLLQNPGIVRNRLKIVSAVSNARALLAIQAEMGSFDAYIWQFVDGRAVQNRWSRLDEVPSKTPASNAIGRALKARGFQFVGSTICYAFMQAVGMVNDHTADCFRQRELSDSPRRAE